MKLIGIFFLKTVLIMRFFVVFIFFSPYVIAGNYHYLESKKVLSKVQLEDGSIVQPITTIYQDSDDYMWFGSPWGLYRYNGYTVKSFSQESITCITEDREGNLWVGTENGLMQLGPFREKVNYFVTHPNEQDSLHDNYITCLLYSSNDVFWIGTNEGVNRLDEMCHKWIGNSVDTSNPSNRLIRDHSNKTNDNKSSANEIEIIEMNNL